MEKEVEEILQAARDLAARYKKLTGKPLGITGEVAEFSAAKLLGLELAAARTAGFDAFGADKRKIQIKGRSLPPDSKLTQRIGAIRLNHEWDSVILVLMDDALEVLEIWEAYRPAIEAALLTPGSKARNERGALSVGKFKQIGSRVWSQCQV